ncbi:hypothetical protein GA0115240_17208 [Streptomyces sp. DvalAA-14]|uniref:DUF6344 domain-containing protein n=1 Tax=unclassified Streptomyces TaxID=2593676 RepID=UPI00081B8203|nr:MULTISPECIES: DUF6344 domain-containing protein [unclassified Streptomyces]MYS24955.1 hypothetical protein [Streptomyces sp. SID4948]SCE50895.1 hypothetical protein GA0115240_17208 [Streptomyces sp. DvalAA-14]
MAAAVEVRTFWSALLSVLLKCIAALGFATPASRAAAARVDAPGAAQAQGQGAAQVAGRTDAVRIGGQSVPRIPAPRGYEPTRQARTRTLPPTMKQRIRAEAHGSSPSARSVRTGDLAEDISAVVALAEAAARKTADPGTASGVGADATSGAGTGVGAGVGADATSGATAGMTAGVNPVGAGANR